MYVPLLMWYLYFGLLLQWGKWAILFFFDKDTSTMMRAFFFMIVTTTIVAIVSKARLDLHSIVAEESSAFYFKNSAKINLTHLPIHNN